MSDEQKFERLEGPGSEERLRAMQARFRAVTPKNRKARRLPLRLWLLPALIGAVLGMTAFLLIEML